MGRLFNLSDVLQLHQETKIHDVNGKAIQIKFENEHLRKIDNIKNLLGELPKLGDTYFIWSQKSFNAYTFIMYIIKHCGVIDELIISTYAINERIINAFIRALNDKYIKHLTIIISESIKARNSKIYDLLISLATHDNVIIEYAWNHSKVTLALSNDNYFVIEGSGNFSENAQFEQYIFANHPTLYEFRKSCIIK